MKKSDTFHLNLPSFSISVRTLFSGYLLVMGIGFLMAGAQILLTHGMADGKLGVSVDDIVYSYHGNRNSSKLESKLKGSMKDKANALDRMILIKWAREGAKEEEWKKVQPVFEGNCIQCHSTIPGLPTFGDYESSAEVAKTDMGASIDSLTRVSHIHLFGIAFIFIFVGFIFSFAVGLSQKTKAVIIAIPFIFLIVDIFSWWITKSYPGFAWFTIIGGFGYIFAFAIMIATSMYQMWVLPYNGKVYTSNEWDDSQ
ncbi:MAG TPA: elongation factor-1 alpha [Sulfurimonas sp.]|nr:elongation factor-1 alpha [Sulfurimonas sp.]